MSLWRVIFANVYLNKNVCRWISSAKMPYYAVARGRTAGIYMAWPDCEAQVKGFPGARYKKFDTVTDAQDFISSVDGSARSTAPSAKQYNNYTKAIPNTSKYNLKRPYSTSSSYYQKKNGNSSKSYSSPKDSQESTESDRDDSDTFSESSDDLNAVINKQMDDIEKRLKVFEKGVDKIMKKGTSKVRKTVLIEPPQPKRQRKNSTGFEEDSDGFVQVYTDGACSSNGKSSARAGIGVYWGEGHSLNTSEPVSGRATNNCGEIQAATHAIKLALQNGVQKLSINTDSQFLINSVTKWMPGWKRKGWKLQSGEPVKNEKDFKDLDSVQNQLQIKWNYVEAHRGIHGNEMADQLAKAGAAKYQ